VNDATIEVLAQGRQQVLYVEHGSAMVGMLMAFREELTHTKDDDTCRRCAVVALIAKVQGVIS